jgi:hypothetical protein
VDADYLGSMMKIVGDSASQWSKRSKVIELQGSLLNIEAGPKVDDSRDTGIA